MFLIPALQVPLHLNDEHLLGGGVATLLYKELHVSEMIIFQ